MSVWGSTARRLKMLGATAVVGMSIGSWVSTAMAASDVANVVASDTTKFDPDGSLDIYVQAGSPGNDHQSHWPPVKLE